MATERSGLLLPLLALAAVVGLVDLVDRGVHGAGGGARLSKVEIAHPAPATLRARAVAPLAVPAAPAESEDEAEPEPAAEAPDTGRWTRRFDQYFRKYTKHYFGVDFDWRWFKAQAIVESTLDPQVRSSAGAVGLMQIKPSTFHDIRRHHPEIPGMLGPRWNIAAGIVHMCELYNKPALREYPDDTRLYLSFASYNSGYTRLLQAMHRASPARYGWRATLRQAPDESRHYVHRIIQVKTDALA